MAKTRLTNNKRELLTKLARKLVTEMFRKRLKMDKVDADFRTYLIKKIRADYPEADMAVLKKYGSASTLTGTYSYDRHLRLCLDSESSTVRVYSPDAEVGSILIPSSSRGNIINVTGPVARQWFEKHKHLNAIISEKMADYESLINTANTYEDVLDLWPSAESLRKEITGTVTALTTLNDAVKIRILNDQKEMVKLTVEEKAA
jgi:hypothetical protein